MNIPGKNSHCLFWKPLVGFIIIPGIHWATHNSRMMSLARKNQCILFENFVTAKERKWILREVKYSFFFGKLVHSRIVGRNDPLGNVHCMAVFLYRQDFVLPALAKPSRELYWIPPQIHEVDHLFWPLHSDKKTRPSRKPECSSSGRTNIESITRRSREDTLLAGLEWTSFLDKYSCTSLLKIHFLSLLWRSSRIKCSVS